MIRLKWLVICVLLCAADAYSESKWIRMQSPNFEAYSSAGERDTRDTLRYFERVRDFFLQLDQREPEKPLPVYVVVFGSEKEYAPYRLNQFATAYYFGGADRDYIVMGRPGEQVAQLAVHEYVHLVARHAGLNLPPWLNEGIAELYSTLRMQGDKVLIGDLIPGRLQALQREKWVPLSVIVSGGQDSPYYNEKNKGGSLYNVGWALVHMLELSPDYVSKFSQFMGAVQKGTDSVTALEKTYGKPIATIEKDLQGYIVGNQFYARLFPAKLANSKEKFAAAPAPMFDVKLALADLANRPGTEAEPRFFTLLATAQIQLGDRAGARITVAKLAANTKTPEDRTRVEQMQRYLDQANAPAPVIARNTPEGPPRLVRPAPTAERPPLQPSPEVEGSFVEFICLDKTFKVVVDTAQGKKSFLIPDAKQVVIVGRAGGKVDLNCGPQTPVHVKIEYAPNASATDADGILKILYFNPDAATK